VNQPDGDKAMNSDNTTAATAKRSSNRWLQLGIACMAFGAIAAGMGWAIDSCAATLPALYIAAVLSGLGAGLAARFILVPMRKRSVENSKDLARNGFKVAAVGRPM